MRNADKGSRSMGRGARPPEQEAVRTTIVGGRPPGSGKSVGDIPRGIEVLIKKASVDPDFRRALLDKRGGAAEEIGLVLDPAEAAMLAAVPAGQLEAIIAQTRVSPMSRAAFLGRAAAVMLAALGAGVGCDQEERPAGIRPERPKAEKPAPPKPSTERPAALKPASAQPAPPQPMMPVAGAVPGNLPPAKGTLRKPASKDTSSQKIAPDRPVVIAGIMPANDAKEPRDGDK